MIGNAFLGKLFVTDRFFTIAIRRKDSHVLYWKKPFVPDYIVPADRSKWIADPMLAEANGKTYLFYEAVLGNKGHIEVAEVMEDCTLKNLKIVLQDEFHYSYPFVFQYEGNWYMIPESSAANEVRLYQSVHFPDRWKLSTILLEEKAVDTTVFQNNGQLYLITFFLTQGSEKVIPHAYEFKLHGDEIGLKEIEWERYDELRVRGAGPFFREEDKLIRPAQVNQEQRYGDGLVFYEVFTEDTYHESNLCEMGKEGLKAPNYYVDGLHTYCASSKFEAIDIRCGVINLLKPFYKLLKKVRKI